jgi:hypothetical protein
MVIFLIKIVSLRNGGYKGPVLHIQTGSGFICYCVFLFQCNSRSRSFQVLYVFLGKVFLSFFFLVFTKFPPAVQECEVAVRSRTEALADWYKAGQQLVQNPWLSTKFICPNCPTFVLLLYFKELKSRSAVHIFSHNKSALLSFRF